MFYATDPDTDYNDAADERARDEHAPDERELQVLSHVHDVVDRHRAPASTDAADSAADTPNQAPVPGHLSQRSIARALGMSVGLTNAILKRLTDKGFLMMRRINHNNAHYLVTPAGVEQISRRSYLYLRRTIGHVVRYKERLREFCREQQHAGVREIVLIGESDLAFILEWCAEKEGLGSRQVEGDGNIEPSGPAEPLGSEARPSPDRMGGAVVYILSELHPEAASRDADGAVVPLHKIALGNH